ncbi:transmembrane protein 44 isoform X1 [Pleurodeles waltl]|uniref:transmembrane protein 44 isoform X1 n=1 Tax=Pleurodeles waltl TaxID=8319 RepID=UPI003709C0A6
MGVSPTGAPGNGTDEARGQQFVTVALWNWDYLTKCFAEEKVCLSFGLWALASLLWITSHALLFYLRYSKKSRHEDSVICSVYSFFGNMCNTIGALLSKQLTIQIFTGGYMAAIDVINFVLTLFPICGVKFRPRSGRRHSRQRRKYRSSLFAVFLLFSAGTGGYILAARGVPSLEDYHGPRRRLLGTALQESAEIIGFTLGIVAVIISWTSRGPLITKVCKGKPFPGMQLWANFFSVMASLLYAAAIMAHDRKAEYFIRATPWFLIFLGSAALDVAITILSCLMKSKFTRKMGLVVQTFETPDMRALLAREEEEAEEENELEEKLEGMDGEKSSNWTPLKMFPTTRTSHKVSEIGRYMDLSIEPVQKGGYDAIRLPGDGETSAVSTFHKELPAVRHTPAPAPLQVIHANISSTSSPSASSTNSGLEWDFEDLNQQWNGNHDDMSNIEPHDSSVLNVRSRENSDFAQQSSNL